MSKDRYNPIMVGIGKKGEWLEGEPFFINEDDPSKIALNPGLREVCLEKGMIGDRKIDVVFPIIHGTLGEDGCLQGFLQMHHLPFVGSSVLGSAVGMDKDIMKRLFLQGGIPCARYITLYHWQKRRPSFEEVKKELGLPLFVKPCNLGSSLGISRCYDAEEYQKAVETAFEFDNKVVVEENIEGREIEVSLLGDEDLLASLPGEIIPPGGFYSYDSKYIQSEETKLVAPVELDEASTSLIQETAKKAFRLLELSGLTRADFFLKKNGEIYLNEVNTLPGFTSISMYSKLLEATGISYPELIDRLLELALKRFAVERKLKRFRG